MKCRDLYTEFEWHTLLFTPLWVFKISAAADGKIDKKEVNALKIITISAEKFENELVHEIISELKIREKEVYSEFAEDERDPRRGLKKALELLAKLPEKMTSEFKKILIAIGFFIADSSGELYGYRVTEEEIDALSELAHFLGLSAEELEQKPSIKDNIKFLGGIKREYDKSKSDNQA